MRFLGLGLADAVPDANTIWSFREAFKKAAVVDALFARFDAALREAGLSGVRAFETNWADC
jgi:IS5 family transposase